MYERTFTQPAHAFKAVFPLTDDALESAIETAKYIGANKSKIEIVGPLVRVSDPRVQAELNTRQEAMNERAAGLNKAQNDMQKLLTGR